MQLMSDGAVVLEDVEVAGTTLARTRGLMLSEPAPMALTWDSIASRRVHGMLCRGTLDVAWVAGGTVTAVETLEPWTLSGPHECRIIIEAPVDSLDMLEAGDLAELTINCPRGGP
jgi:uncharacterized membrane protein (UPF0127 family)